MISINDLTTRNPSSNLPVKVRRTVRYRLHPGSARKNQQLHGTAGACRFVWNHMVGEIRDEHEAWGSCNFSYRSTKNVSTTELGRVFTILRRHSYKWLQGYSAYIVKSSLQPIETTYREFFKDVEAGGKPNHKPPRFHGKWTTTPSFPINDESAKVAGNSLYVQKVGWMKLATSNPCPDGQFKSGRIRYECDNWYADLVYEIETQARLPHSAREAGIDRNIAEGRRAALSDGTMHGRPDLEKKLERRKRYQRKLVRQVTGSNRRKVTRARWRKAFQAERFARLNRKTLASAWGTLELCLNDKVDGCRLPPAYTSQACHQYGHVDQESRKRSDFKCTACGHADDADLNAALNLLAFGNGAAGRGGGGTGGASCRSRPGKRQEIAEFGGREPVKSS